MKILQLIQKPQLRGAEIFANQLSNHLLEEGHDVQMVSLLPGDAALPFKGKLIKLDRPQSKRLIDIAGWRHLAHYINVIKPDVVQANAGDTLKFAVFSKLIFRWNSSIFFRNANKVSDFIDSWPKLVFNKFLMRHVQHVISVSELCRKDFLVTYSLSPGKATTVPIGIDLMEINASSPVDLQSIFSGASRILVHVGSFVPEKNHVGLIRIVKRLLAKGEDIKMLLIGDGKLRQFIQKEIVEQKLIERVILLGNRTDVLSIMAKAHVFILPSNIEGLPAVILEAMYCRTPVVAYNVGGISEVVRQGDTGWLVSAGDEERFVEAIREVLHAPDLELIREKAYTMVVNEFDNSIIAKRFLEVYRKIV